MKKRIVVTGIGVLSSAGAGRDTFWNSLKSGFSGIKPVSVFSAENLKTKLAGEIPDFDPKSVLGAKGLRNLDRVTLIGLSAAKIALKDARLEEPFPEDQAVLSGVSFGSTMGSVMSTSEFDKTSLIDGPRSVNPGLFPNTVMNSPSSNISIKYNIKGFNTTISTGFCSSLDSIFYAVLMMRLYGYRTVLAGGAEELCEQTYKGFYKLGLLAGTRDMTEEISCPFDKRRNGIILSEGGGFFVLEDAEHAEKRQAPILAEILGCGSCFDPLSDNFCNPRAGGAANAMNQALRDAGIGPRDIDCVIAGANSTLDCDIMETAAVKKVFGEYSREIPVSAVKSMIGDAFSAGGILNACAGVGAISMKTLFPTINNKILDPRCALNYAERSSEADIKRVMVNAFSPMGNNSSLIIGEYE